MRILAEKPKSASLPGRAARSKPHSLNEQVSAGTAFGLGRDFSGVPVRDASPWRGRGNNGFVKKDEPDKGVAAQEPVAAPAVAPSQPAAPAVVSYEQANVSGTIPDVVTNPGEGRTTGQERVEEVPGAAGPGNVVADIRISSSQPRRDRVRGGKQDAVASGVSVGSFSQPGGRPVSPFGEESYEPAFTGISYAFAGGKCTISAKLDVICPWGTNSGGDIDVPSATAPVVTKAKWPDIKKDLTPSATSPFKSPRDKYYSQALVEKHEKFHGTDDNAWTSSSGLGIVKAKLESGTVTAPAAGDIAGAVKLGMDVGALVESARVKLVSENGKFYKGAGTDHDSYAGEIRAYSDGKASYQKLADDVEKQGKSLP